jgi:NAD(P)-dependent dehydrogenase (short-subunit alcohol dehydrogenase family)
MARWSSSPAPPAASAAPTASPPPPRALPSSPATSPTAGQRSTRSPRPAAVDAAVRHHGGLDGLVNNAALYAGLTSGPFDRLDLDEWDATIRVNVTGVFLMCRAAVPAMRDRDTASIVNISSLAAVYGLPNALHYTTSKAAVLGITRGLARELGRYWIRVNSVAPSAVTTEGTDEFFGSSRQRALDAIASQQALRRNLEPGDVAGTVIHLLSDESRFVTGQTLMVDGGTITT